MSSTLLIKCVCPRIRLPPSGISRGTSFSSIKLNLLLFGRRGGRLVVHYIAVVDGGLPFVVLVVLVFHRLADAHRSVLEVQRVIGMGVSGEPVFAVDLLAVG